MKASPLLSAEIHRADWSLIYPVQSDAEGIHLLLQPYTLVAHTWEVFPWQMTGRMLNVLQCPQGIYEYLHLVLYFRARAAMLALTGKVLDRRDLFRAMNRHQAQIGGIYREHLIVNLQGYLRKSNLAGLPECHSEDSVGEEEDEKIELNRRSIRKVVRAAEAGFMKTLDFISVATRMEEEVAGHSVGFWVGGGDKPKGKEVGARVRRFEGGYVIRPSDEDTKRMIGIGQTFEPIAVGEADSTELGAPRAEMADGRLQTKDGKSGERGASSAEGKDDRLQTAEGRLKSAGRDQKSEEDRRTDCASHIGERERKKKGEAREPASDAVAKKAAELVLAAVAPALRCSKLNPDRGATDDLVQAFTLERKKRATDRATFRALARLDIEVARKTPDKAPWMRVGDANRHYNRAVRGEAVRADDVATRAFALERRYRRALREAG
jgi:hypothetical protein